MCLAFMAMSLAWPSVPPITWWIITSELGSENLLPFLPEERIKAPIEAAIPTHMVETSLLIKCIVSMIASPAVTEPPGELI